MNKVIFEKKSNKHLKESLIPNGQLEQMFLSIASDEQMAEYTKLVDKGLMGTATAYASHKVNRTFMYFRDSYIKNGGDLEFLQFSLWKRTRLE